MQMPCAGGQWLGAGQMNVDRFSDIRFFALLSCRYSIVRDIFAALKFSLLNCTGIIVGGFRGNN